MIRNILFFSFLLAFVSLEGQTLNAYEKAGDKAFEQRDYYNAVYYYEQVLKSRKKAGLYYKYAEACRHSFAYLKAESAYAKVKASKQAADFEELDFYYGLSLKHNAKYEEAAAAFGRFLSTSRAEGDALLRAKALQEQAACGFAPNLIENPDKTVRLQRLGNNINSEFSDFAAHENQEGQLFYSSLRFDRKAAKEEKEQKEKRLISKLMMAEDTSARGMPVPMLNQQHLHNANSCFSKDGKRMYFTRCRSDRSDSLQCAIYLSYMQENGNWSKALKLAAPVNLSNSSSTQPMIATVDEEEWLFFASNRKAALGGYDLFKVKLEKDSIAGAIQHLPESINSILNEATPFFHSESKRLYFSSEWHPGLGGFDVFYSDWNSEDKLWSKPVNMGLPFNSAANDLYFVLNNNDSSGYFASNRLGSMNITEASCCNDIYAFFKEDRLPPVIIPDTPMLDTITVAIVEEPPVVTIPPSIDEKIEELNSMLPLKLYFHNDEPDSNVTVKETDIPYHLTYEFYLTLKDKYQHQHSSQFPSDEQSKIRKKVLNFFTDEVEAEYARTQEFYDAVLDLLKEGVALEVQIKGHTSPRSYEGYNIALAHRRITSVRKDFFVYRNGAFLNYFQQGLLTVTELPLGESQSPQGVPDAFNDPKNSIYGVEASRERRVEILVLQKAPQ